MAFFTRKQKDSPQSATPTTTLRPPPVMQVLMVGSDGSVATLLNRSAAHGIRGDYVSDPDEALLRARAFSYDVLVAALTPVGDLATFCRDLVAGGIDRPVLAVLQTASTADIVTVLDSGASGILTAGMDEAELIVRIQAARRRHEYNRGDLE